MPSSVQTEAEPFAGEDTQGMPAPNSQLATHVYLDHAASAPLCEAAAQAMQPFVHCGSPRTFGNANSLHSQGRGVFAVLEQCRTDIATAFKVRPNEVVFSGCATESNNAALFGLVAAQKDLQANQTAHVVTSSIEHDSMFQAAKMLERMHLAQVSYVAPRKSGHVHPDDVAAHITERTVLVSVMAANNETGAINDIAAIGSIAHDAGALFHTDAVQLLGKAPLHLRDLPVDAASFSAHKIGGPQGVGCLYLKTGTPYMPLLAGGGQEEGKRSGTQNIAGIAGFAAACNSLCDPQIVEQQAVRLRALRDTLYTRLCAHEAVVKTVPCDADSCDYLPHIVNVCVKGWESESLILQLDLAGFSVSGGSACSSHSLEPSRTLLALGIPRNVAFGSLRVSLGPSTTEADIDAFLQAFDNLLQQHSA